MTTHGKLFAHTAQNLLSFIKIVVECGAMWGFLCNFEPKFHIKDVCMRFLGHIEARIDAKGRAFFPAVFRKTLQASGEEHLILRKDVFQPCLVLYPESVWNQQLDFLRSRLNRWNQKHQQIFRMFISDVELMSLDSNGRILIPKRYLKTADIEQEIRFIGMDDTIEIWNHSDDDQPFMEPKEFVQDLQKIMTGDPTVSCEGE